MKTMTVEKAIKLTGAKSANDLAKMLGISHQAVYLWNGTVPGARISAVKAIAASRKVELL